MLGAVLAGLVGMKVHDDLTAVAQLARETVDFTPAISAVTAAEIYEGWRTAVQQVLYQPQQG